MGVNGVEVAFEDSRSKWQGPVTRRAVGRARRNQDSVQKWDSGNFIPVIRVQWPL